jgi:hypothetical protein
MTYFIVPPFKNHRCVMVATAMLLLLSNAALAQSPAPTDQDVVIAELLKKMHVQEQRITKLEKSLSQTALASQDVDSNDDDISKVTAGKKSPEKTITTTNVSPLILSGDLRVRFERNNGAGNQRNDARGAVRGRVGATYIASPSLKLGARLVTGNPDDPNSADVSLSNFNDNLQVSLDQMYGAKTFGSLTVIGGKFPTPFRRTDLLWDGDVNPQGLAAQYKAVDTGRTQIAGAALLFPIERSVGGPDSNATAYQMTLDHQLSTNWKVGLAGGYYNFEISATDTADTGDTRTNLLDQTGAYVSDFDILDVIVDLSYSGFSDRWPIKIQYDYVQNLGADQYDKGLSIAASVGQLNAIGDYSFGYAYNVAEADAVFAAFSQDNIPYASNYRQHTYSLTYAISEQLALNTALYTFKPKDTALFPTAPLDWQHRLRVNLISTF